MVGWLVSAGAGHCDLFAGSLVLLARSAGLPARVITGFRGGSWNAYSNNFTVRNSEAHAWAELFDEAAGGWRRVDPLQPESPEQAAGATGPAAAVARVDRSWTARWDSLRVFWYRRIVSFDDRAQAEALRTVKEVARDSSRWLVDGLARHVESARAWLAAPWDARRWSFGLGLVGLLALVVWTLRTGRWRWRGGNQRRPDPVRREATRWLELLRRETGGDLTKWRVAAELERLRFGAPATWPDPARTFSEARRAVRT
ncbi:MAG: transglutaminase-like domain-containing protein, partial [Opitutaceae bacterium]